MRYHIFAFLCQTQYKNCSVHVCCCKWSYCILWLSNTPLYYFMHLLYSFVCWWTFRLLACLGYCKSVQFSSIAQLCLTLCGPMDAAHQASLSINNSEFTQTHVHWVGDAIQPSHPLLSPSPPAFNLSQHQGLFKWVSSSHQVAKVSKFQLHHQSLQWIFRTDFL